MTTFGVLFDLDGVLVDSETTYTRFWKEIDEIYPTGIHDFAVAIKGTTLPSILEYFPDDAVREDIKQRLTEFQGKMRFPFYPGAEQLLKELKELGIPTAIVTSSDKSKMELLFAQHPQLKELVTAVIDASHVTRSKPDPQGYMLGAQAIGVVPQHCFVFEDSLQGLAAGRAAGATVVGIATTYPVTRISPLADIVIDSISHINVATLIDKASTFRP
jgi:HAD hydrolase, family IA, variant 3